MHRRAPRARKKSDFRRRNYRLRKQLGAPEAMCAACAKNNSGNSYIALGRKTFRPKNGKKS
jgi:hypothetical protein